jgi:hypothetical protein
MPEHSLRFGVRALNGNTSDVWKCWTATGTQRRDVYLTSRPLGHALKLSLHESGQWHLGFDSNKRDKLFNPGTVPETRFLGRWQRDQAGTAPLVLAVRIYFPSASPSEAQRPAPLDTVWIEAAPEGQSTEVAIFLINVTGPVINWPGKNALGTKLVGRLPLEGGGQVCVVHRTVTTWPEAPAVLQGKPRYFRDRSEADLAEANRIVTWGEEADGSISFVETRLVVECKGAA